jgi:hypothetical protein
MNDKFELYDILAVLIPGAIVMGILSVTFPEAVTRFTPMRFPNAFAVIWLVAVATFMGHLIQAITSLIEPLIYWTWGGRPSDRALHSGLGMRYLPVDTGKRIRAKLIAALGKTTSDRSLFLFAMQKAETSGNTRVAKFNGLYAYHRAMLTLVLVALAVILASMRWGRAQQWTIGEKTEVVIAGVLLLLIFWFRAKQRGFYYVREVLSTAERLIDTAAGSTKVQI